MTDKKELMDEIYRRNQEHRARLSKRVVGTPEVGVFWVLGKRILIDSIPITEADEWQHFKTYPGDHIALWRAFKKSHMVPQDLEYDKVPRGRVGYNARSEKYSFLADRCILEKKSLVDKIMGKMNLRHEDTEIGTDDHYRCPKCLEKDR